MKTWLFNPFKYLAGNKALWLGIVAIAITGMVCLAEKLHMDGVIDIHGPKETPTYFYFTEPVIDWLCLVIPLYIFGRILSVSAIRFIDVAGTGALARYPMFFVVLLTMLMPKQIYDPKYLMNAIQTNPALLAQVVMVAFLIIPFVVWTVALMYNAYSISTNLKGQKATWSFVVSILIAEVISKAIIAVLIK